MKSYAMALDLNEDPGVVEEYTRYHREVWPDVLKGLSNYLKMARRHCRRNHRSAHASCNTPR